MYLAQQLIWSRPDDSLYLAWEDMLVREGEKQYSISGSLERSNFVTFRERTVLGAFSQQASALCPGSLPP